MKFLADMGISPRTVDGLRRMGYDAIHLVEQGLERFTDEEILVKAQNENRIILTMDLDFGYLLASRGESFPSVILFRLGNESRQIIEERLQIVFRECIEDLQAGAIVSVSDDSFRVRRLPI